MTREEAKVKLPLIKAFAEGKDVQILIDGIWTVVSRPDFSAPVEKYRLRPEPKEFFINIINEIPQFAYTQKGLDRMVDKSQLNLIKVREVLE